MSSVFSLIISGDIPAFKIAEDNFFVAFLDIEPLREGHVLVVPKVEIDKAYELDEVYLQRWMTFARPIALAQEKAFDCKRVGISFIGLEVPHAHMHLVPINTVGDMNFAQKPTKPSMEVLEQVQQKILHYLA